MLTVFALVWLHFIADFICQTDKMALNKSKSFKWLGIHCLVYSIFLVPFGLWFALANGVMHFSIDGLSSRATSYLWKNNERHWFFVVIGLDQAIHLTLLLLSWRYICA